MQAKPECVVCLFRQALNTARVVSDDPAVQIEVLREVARRVTTLPLNQTPAALSKPVYEVVVQVTGVRDPYAKIKQQTTKAALRLVPEFEKVIQKARDPLHAAVHLSVAGNIIDLGIGHPFDLEQDIARIMKQKFAVDDFADFKRDLRRAQKLLFIGDNAGEAAFDRVLIEQIQKAGVQVTFTVKSGPIINDATLADAEAAGLTKVCKVIETGSDDIGVNWPRASSEFRRHAREADLIIGKGHGNFETCAGQPGNYYFLLKAKCVVVAEALRVKVGDIAFKHQKGGR